MTTTPRTQSVHVRLPVDMIEELHRLADEDGVALNALLVGMITESSSSCCCPTCGRWHRRAPQKQGS